jgi:hypothetical protein
MRRMSIVTLRRLALVGLVVLLAGLTDRAGTSVEGPYRLNGYEITAGGGMSAAGPYTLSGMIGQPVLGECSGGPYRVVSGRCACQSPMLTPWHVQSIRDSPLPWDRDPKGSKIRGGQDEQELQQEYAEQ